MMDWTDRHCRAFHRGLTRRARLYTEMLTSAALMGFDPVEHPVALQLGGADPRELAAAARIGEDMGYDEVNLNVGCPSDRVQSGRFGACLMREPALVAECMAAIGAAVRIPATVKCRIGVDDQDPEQSLFVPRRPLRPGGGDDLRGARAQGVAEGAEPARRTATSRPWTIRWSIG